MEIQALDGDVQGFSFALERNAEGWLQLRALHRPDYGPIHADWQSAEIRSRIAAGRKQLLARACALGKQTDLSLLDATAGLGRDGYTLAALGAQVTLCERHPLIVELLRDAARRCGAAIQILHADAASLLGSPPRHAQVRATTALFQERPPSRSATAPGVALPRASMPSWDVIYLDPMYPDKAKSALPGKEMQLFRELTGGDADADALLGPALAAARRRVVVKRPRHAPHLAGREPSLQMRSNQARYDVYLVEKRGSG